MDCICYMLCETVQCCLFNYCEVNDTNTIIAVHNGELFNRIFVYAGRYHFNLNEINISSLHVREYNL